MKKQRYSQTLELLSLLRYSWGLKYLLIRNGSKFSTFTSTSREFKIHAIFAVHAFFSVISQAARAWCIFLSPHYVSIQDMLVDVLWTQGYVVMFFLYIHILCYREGICNFLNMWIRFEERLDREWNSYQFRCWN